MKDLDKNFGCFEINVCHNYDTFDTLITQHSLIDPLVVGPIYILFPVRV